MSDYVDCSTLSMQSIGSLRWVPAVTMHEVRAILGQSLTRTGTSTNQASQLTSACILFTDFLYKFVLFHTALLFSEYPFIHHKTSVLNIRQQHMHMALDFALR